jgi:hypothetical protein
VSAPTRYRDAAGTEVEALHLVTADDIRAAHALTAWHEGQVRLLTYPTAPPQMFVGLGNDLARHGRPVNLGQYLVKGPAGDLEPMPAAMFEDRYTEVAA